MSLSSFKSRGDLILTAWHMLHRTREAMNPTQEGSGMFGTLEVHATYLSGEERGVGPGQPVKKSKETAVLGIIEHNGRVACKAVPNVGAQEIVE